METDQKTLDKWLQTALQNTKSSLGQGGGELLEKKTAESITPHEVVSYMIPAGAFLSSTLFPALLSLGHPHHPRSLRHTPLTFYRPYTTISAKPSLSFLVVGALGLVLLDVLKSAVASRKKREMWPVWKQAIIISADERHGPRPASESRELRHTSRTMQPCEAKVLSPQIIILSYVCFESWPDSLHTTREGIESLLKIHYSIVLGQNLSSRYFF
jgi:hypothetical protein